MHSGIWLAARMSQMSHCIDFKIRGNCELFYNWVVFLNGHCLSLGNHCYSVVGLRQQLAATDPPFSNTTLTRSFRSEMHSGSTQDEYLTSAVSKYSSRKITLKKAQDGEKNMTHDSVNIFFKLLLKIFFKILHFGTNYSHCIVHMYFFYK